LRTDFGEGFGDCCDEGFDGSGGGLSQQGFEFGEELFDGVEVWALGGQVAQLGAGSFDGFADAGDLVAITLIMEAMFTVMQQASVGWDGTNPVRSRPPVPTMLAR